MNTVFSLVFGMYQYSQKFIYHSVEFNHLSCSYLNFSFLIPFCPSTFFCRFPFLFYLFGFVGAFSFLLHCFLSNFNISLNFFLVLIFVCCVLSFAGNIVTAMLLVKWYNKAVKIVWYEHEIQSNHHDHTIEIHIKIPMNPLLWLNFQIICSRYVYIVFDLFQS